MRRSAPKLRMLLAGAALGVLMTGCVGGGIRRLEDLEYKYYHALQQELARSRQPITDILQLHRKNDEQAIREIELLRAKIRHARLVYSVREMLTAPKHDRAGFIQVTRNKVLLYHLAETAAAENEQIDVAIRLAEERRQRLDGLFQELTERIHQVTTTEEALHRYFNQSELMWLRDTIQEVERQLGNFNGEIRRGDQSNPTIAELTRRGEQAAAALTKVEDALNLFIEIWNQRNKP